LLTFTCFGGEIKEIKKNQEECKNPKGLLEDAGVSNFLWRNTYSPTYTLKIETFKICDIISPGFQGLTGDICYLFTLSKRLNFYVFQMLS
jgi:hypothetical protein